MIHNYISHIRNVYEYQCDVPAKIILTFSTYSFLLPIRINVGISYSCQGQTIHYLTHSIGIWLQKTAREVTQYLN